MYCRRKKEARQANVQGFLAKRVTLSTFAALRGNATTGLVRGAPRCFAALSMTKGGRLWARGIEMLRCAQHDKRGLSMTRGALMGAGQGMLCCSIRGVYPERSEWAQGKLREGAQDKAQHDTRGDR